MEVDPLASMRCWAIEIELGGRTYDVPALPAVDWWPVLSNANPLDVLDLIEGNNLDDRLMEGELDHAGLVDGLREAVEESAGRSFHATVVLVMVANSQWPIVSGQLIRNGFRWEGQPLGAALDAIYATIVEVLDKENREKFLALLDNEALTNGKPTKRQRAKLTDEFESMAGPRPTTGVKATGAPSDSARPRTQPRLRQPRPAARSRAPRQPRAPRAESDRPASS